MLLHLLRYILRYSCSSLIVEFPKIPLQLSPVCLVNFLSLIIRSAAQVPFISLPFLKNISRRIPAELSHPWGLETLLTVMVSDGKSAVNPIMVPPCVMCHFCLGGFDFPWLVWWCSWCVWPWFSKMYSSVSWMDNLWFSRNVWQGRLPISSNVVILHWYRSHFAPSSGT